MRLLLDTHIFLWVETQDTNLPETTRRLILDRQNEVFLSAVTGWETSIKLGLKKLRLVRELSEPLEAVAMRSSFQMLPISFRHGVRAGQLPLLHRDPFDRMLIAQALEEDLVLVSNEELFDGYGVRRVW